MKFVCNKLGLITMFYAKMFGNKSLHFHEQWTRHPQEAHQFQCLCICSSLNC